MKRNRILFLRHLLPVLLVTLSLVAVSSIRSQPPQQAVPDLTGRVIYFSESNDEANLFDRSEFGMSRFAGLLQLAGAQLMPLDWRRDVPPDADVVLVGGPLKNLNNAQVARLWAYLNNGGRVMLLVDPLVLTLDRGVRTMVYNDSNEATKGIFELTWPDLGVRARDDVVLREDVEDVAVSSEMGIPGIEAQSEISHFAATRVGADHPILDGIEGELQFFGARSVEFDASIQPFEASALVYTPDGFYGETAYEEYLTGGPAPFYTAEDTSPDGLVVAAASENPTTGARIVVIGDRELLTNGFGLQTSPPNSTNFLYPNNVTLGLNTIGWLLGAEQNAEVELTFEPPLPTATVTPTFAPTATPDVQETATAEAQPNG